MARKRKGSGKRTQVAMPVMRPNAAGIDIGATEIFVAVPADRATENVRCFPTFTQDLYALADWLKECGVKTVAMESTGVYWIPLFQAVIAEVQLQPFTAGYLDYLRAKLRDLRAAPPAGVQKSTFSRAR